MDEDRIEALAEESLSNVKEEAERVIEDGDDLHGVMIVTADDHGVRTTGHVHAESDVRLMSLWMLAAFMAHVADSAESEMHPLEAAEWAISIMNDYDPDATAEEL